MNFLDNFSLSSGKVKELESVIWENPRLKQDRKNKKGVVFATVPIRAPAGTSLTGQLPRIVYEEYKRGKEAACADIVVTTRLPKGTPAILSSKRAKNVCFGGKWWVYGGAVLAYQPLKIYILDRVEKECGVRPKIIEGLIGFYRTCAEDYPASTTQPCFVTSVPYEVTMKALTDKNHTHVKLLTLRDIKNLPKKEQHWYPMRCFRKALESMK